MQHQVECFNQEKIIISGLHFIHIHVYGTQSTNKMLNLTLKVK